jgi:hypothetical protein
MPLAQSYEQARIQVEGLVDRFHRNLAAATMPADRTLYQRQIDALVYELPDLMDDEVQIVEEAT